MTKIFTQSLIVLTVSFFSFALAQGKTNSFIVLLPLDKEGFSTGEQKLGVIIDKGTGAFYSSGNCIDTSLNGTCAYAFLLGKPDSVTAVEWGVPKFKNPTALKSVEPNTFSSCQNREPHDYLTLYKLDDSEPKPTPLTFGMLKNLDKNEHAGSIVFDSSNQLYGHINEQGGLVAHEQSEPSQSSWKDIEPKNDTDFPTLCQDWTLVLKKDLNNTDPILEIRGGPQSITLYVELKGYSLSFAHPIHLKNAAITIIDTSNRNVQSCEKKENALVIIKNNKCTILMDLGGGS